MSGAKREGEARMELFDPSLSPSKPATFSGVAERIVSKVVCVTFWMFMSVVGSTGDLGFGDYQSTTLTPGFQRLSTTTNAGGGMGPLDLGGKSDKADPVMMVIIFD